MNISVEDMRELKEGLKKKKYNPLERPSMDDTYLQVARVFSERSSCLRRGYGSVIVKNDEVIATGYNGSYRGGINCCDRGNCIREELGIIPGERYELCESQHSESNACLQAKRSDLIGSTLYLYGIEKKTGLPVEDVKPCKMCERLLKNAGVKEIKFYKKGKIETMSLHVDIYMCGRNGT